MASRYFTVFDESIFDHLEFVTVGFTQDCYPPRMGISYPDTEENHQLVNETYSRYEATDPKMVAWLKGKEISEVKIVSRRFPEIKTVNRRFVVFDASIFDHLRFVTIGLSQESWPLRLGISYPDTEENHRVVNETYSKYETTNPEMVAWLNGTLFPDDAPSHVGNPDRPLTHSPDRATDLGLVFDEKAGLWYYPDR